jgi:PhnB protein
MADAPKVKAVPKGFRTANIALTISGCAKAIEFYKKAFNAKELMRMAMPDGGIAHAELKIGNTLIMLSDEFPPMALSPKTIGGSGSRVVLYVRNCDRVFKRAVKAGATSRWSRPICLGRPLVAGHRPFGHIWAIATHKEDVGPEELVERSKKWMAEMAAAKQG